MNTYRLKRDCGKANSGKSDKVCLKKDRAHFSERRTTGNLNLTMLATKRDNQTKLRYHNPYNPFGVMLVRIKYTLKSTPDYG